MVKINYIYLFVIFGIISCHTASPKDCDKRIVSDSISDKTREYYEVTKNDTSALSCIVDELYNGHLIVNVICIKSGKVMHRSNSNRYYEYSSDIENIDLIHKCIEALPPHYNIEKISQFRLNILVFPNVSIEVTTKLGLNRHTNSLKDYDRIVDAVKHTAFYGKVEKMLISSGMQIEDFSIGDMITYVDISSIAKYKNSQEISNMLGEIVDCDFIFSVQPIKKNCDYGV